MSPQKRPEPQLWHTGRFHSATGWKSMAAIAHREEVKYGRFERRELKVSKKLKAHADTVRARNMGSIFADGRIDQERILASADIAFKAKEAEKRSYVYRHMSFNFKLARFGATALAMDNHSWNFRGSLRATVSHRVVRAVAAGALVDEFIEVAKKLSDLESRPDFENMPYATRYALDVISEKPAKWVALLREEKCLLTPDTMIALVRQGMSHTGRSAGPKLPRHIEHYIRETLQFQPR